MRQVDFSRFKLEPHLKTLVSAVFLSSLSLWRRCSVVVSAPEFLWADRRLGGWGPRLTRHCCLVSFLKKLNSALSLHPGLLIATGGKKNVGEPCSG